MSMKTAVWFMFLTLLLLPGCGQKHPDFSGTWIEIEGPPIPGAPGGADLQPQITIEQEGNTLTSTVAFLSKTRPDQKPTSAGKQVYELDGVERKNSDGSSSKMYWEGNTLVLVTTRQKLDGISTFQNVWSLDANGNLVMQRTLTNPGEKPATLKSVMKKIQ
jgi:hypothetical protein